MSNFFGYIHCDRVAGVPTLYEAFPKVKKFGTVVGKSIFLNHYYRMATGQNFPTRNQGSTPSCVGHAVAGAVDILRGVRIGGLGLKNETIDAPADATSIYGGSRYEIGYKKHGIKGMIRGGGSRIPYAVEWMQDYGTLYMKDYGNGYDLTEFDQKRCNTWGAKGVPDALEPDASRRKLMGMYYVETPEEAAAALLLGHPVVFGASQGFDGQSSRDSEGFLKPRGTWHHAQFLIGFSYNARRPYFKIQNSWGSRWVGGPNTDDGPEGSYNAEWAVVGKMMKQGEFAALTDMGGLHAR
jgi:hypothetical protein